tara:strand:+ start:169 stop:357 length:189 start_codon:yes stop_codon:yes gene_type:complete
MQVENKPRIQCDNCGRTKSIFAPSFAAMWWIDHGGKKYDVCNEKCGDDLVAKLKAKVNSDDK